MSGRQFWESWDAAADAFDVVASEFVVATASAADVPEYTALAALLGRVHKAFGIEAAFVSEWSNGEPVMRSHDSRPEADALQILYGHRLLEADAPAGAPFRFDAVPVVTDEGIVHGTLCCRSLAPPRHASDADHAAALRSVARLIANWFDEAQAQAA